MSGKLEVSFNSPQCGWMSIGFDDGVSEFHTTTAHTPHELALPELLQILTDLLDEKGGNPTGKEGAHEYLLKWNRDPEEFDFRFVRDGGNVEIDIYQYPTETRESGERKLIFSHTGSVGDVFSAFAKTFDQLYADRDTDEFEFNWRQPFPFAEFEAFRARQVNRQN
ncbi:MAG: hypothetical protein ACKVQJ_08935 [Pyrinomonadaceae bacterium]